MAESGGEKQATRDAGTADVFISYATADKGAADSICAALESGGIICWIAPRDVTPGVFYADAIVQAINSARILIVVLSVNSAGSQHVLREVERASAKRRPLVAFRLDTTPLPTGLEYFLSASHWLDASGGAIERALPGLTDAVHRLLGHPGKAAIDTSIRDDSTVNASGGVAATKEATPKQLRNRLWIAAAAVAIALLALLTGKFWSRARTEMDARVTERNSVDAPAAAPGMREKSIAVLPFTDMSEKKDQEYFADGMAEEIIDLLANIPGLRVISRTSSFQFKGKNSDLRTVGNALGASYVVEGGVRRSGERFRITAQLISTQNGLHLWSQTYDEPVGDSLKVQDKIASNLARALQVSVGADIQLARPFKSIDAYDLYLRGRHAYDRFDKEGLESAAAYFQQALELDPTAVPAVEFLAVAQDDLAEFGYVEPSEGFERARSSAQRALRLDPKSSLAHVVLAAVHLVYDWDWAAAERDAREAVRLKPRLHSGLGLLGMVNAALGRWDESARLFEAALTLDPLFPAWHGQLGNVRFATGRLQEAEAEQRKQLQISPTFAGGHYGLGVILLVQGKSEAALAEMQQEQPDSGRDAALAVAYHAIGRRAESDAALATLVREHAQDNAFGIAEAYAYRGELDQAFAWLDRAYRQKDSGLYLIKGDQLLKNLAGDPRYPAFLRKMNLPE